MNLKTLLVLYAILLLLSLINEGEIPGAAAKDCGNYLDQNLPMANYLAKKYLKEALNNPSEKNLIYPE